jgi:hypothetical protein
MTCLAPVKTLDTHTDRQPPFLFAAGSLAHAPTEAASAAACENRLLVQRPPGAADNEQGPAL